MRKIFITSVLTLVWITAVLLSDNISFTDNALFSLIDVSLIIAPLALLLRAKSSGWLKELDKTMDKLFE